MAARRDRLCSAGYRDLGDTDDPVFWSLMNTTPAVTFRYREPAPVQVTYNGVSFYKGGAFAAFYRMAEGLGMLESFLEDAKPYYYSDYIHALELKQREEERKIQDSEDYAERRRQWQNEKKYMRRQREKENGITTPDNAVSTNPQKDLYHKGDYTTC